MFKKQNPGLGPRGLILVATCTEWPRDLGRYGTELPLVLFTDLLKRMEFNFRLDALIGPPPTSKAVHHASQASKYRRFLTAMSTSVRCIGVMASGPPRASTSDA